MARPRTHDPRHLDVAAAAQDGAVLEGRWPLAGFARLVEAPADSSAEVMWSALVRARPVAGGEAEVWLELRADTVVTRECQRCLQPVQLPLVVDRRILFVTGEERAAELDADSEDDVLALTRSLDLHGLVEDELLLALPVVPRHENCPQPLRAGPRGSPEAEAAPPPANPFAALAALKTGRHRTGH